MRHRDVWDLCNSGQHATWFAARSDDPVENMRRVHLYPEIFYFPAGGASIHHLAAAGEMTFARFTRHDGRYRLQVVRGAFAYRRKTLAPLKAFPAGFKMIAGDRHAPRA